MLSRRQIISSPLAAGLALASRKATAQSAKRIIVDAQVHFWKANSPDWAWDPGAKPQLPEPFTIERALPMMDEAGVDRVVIVPPSLNDRNDYALEAAERYPNRFGVMGRIPLQDPPIGSGRQPRRLGLPSCFLRSAKFPGSPASRSAIRNSRSSSTTWA